MSSGHKRDMAASVRDRLLILARQTGRNYESLLILYGSNVFFTGCLDPRIGIALF